MLNNQQPIGHTVLVTKELGLTILTVTASTAVNGACGAIADSLIPRTSRRNVNPALTPEVMRGYLEIPAALRLENENTRMTTRDTLKEVRHT